MPGWNDIFKEIQSDPNTDPCRNIRQKYIQKLFKKRNRNIIAYYSGWLQTKGITGTEINDNDKNAFMAVIHGLNRDKGLDLMLHTPGGAVAATESLIDYLKNVWLQYRSLCSSNCHVCRNSDCLRFKAYTHGKTIKLRAN